MALTSGTKLGPYEIQSPLGAGGMGEVYRARDTRLERTVAIKVLNAQLVASTELRARFEREAWVISQLQHPNARKPEARRPTTKNERRHYELPINHPVMNTNTPPNPT